MGPSVPEKFRDEYREAHEVLEISANASAALSRRLLQSVLRKQGAPPKNLVDEINWAKPQLPAYISSQLHNFRTMGNFAAHPGASDPLDPGTIVDVEPEEAEWMLAILAQLFDHYYVQPAKAEEIEKAIRAKRAASKP